MASKEASSFARRVGKAAEVVVVRILAVIGPLLAPKSRHLSRDKDRRNGAGETAVGAEGGAVVAEA